jgi:hypothetical protein
MIRCCVSAVDSCGRLFGNDGCNHRDRRTSASNRKTIGGKGTARAAERKDAQPRADQTLKHVINVIAGGAVVGVIAMAVAGTMFFALEQKWPILRGTARREHNETFTRYFRRMMFCMWITSGLLYIALTYPWPT